MSFAIVLAACGTSGPSLSDSRVVQIDAGNDATVDVSADAAVDVSADAAVDVSADAAVDVSADAAVDAAPAVDAGPPTAQLHTNAGAVNQFGTINNDGVDVSAAQTITVTNIGNEAATNMSLSIDGFNSTFFNITTTTCGSTLNPGDSCSIEVVLGPTTAAPGFGNSALDVSFLPDVNAEGNSTFTAAALKGTVVSATPTITITTTGLDGSNTILRTNAFEITATLTSNVSVPDQVISMGTTSPADSGISFSSSGCTINVGNPTCSITVTIGSSVVPQTYAAAVTGSDISPNLSEVDFTIGLGKRIFITAATFNGNLGGFSGADSLCNADANRPDTSKSYKALLNNNNSTTAGVEYDRPDGTFITIATGGLLSTTLTNSIAGAFTNQWDGAESRDCAVWTDGSSDGTFGGVGNAGFTSAVWFDAGSNGCSVVLALDCVEQ